MIQQKLNENQGKILSVLFQKGKCDLFELQSLTGIEGRELAREITHLKNNGIINESHGIYSSDFFSVIDKLLEEKEVALANA